MIPPVRFTVIGDPVPQAGMTTVPTKLANGKTVYRKITEGGRGLQSWRQDVSNAAQIARDAAGQSFTGPVELAVEFRFRMPTSRPKWAKLQRFLLKTTKPDLDKIVRAVGDSLTTGGLIGDDAAIVQIRARKVEVWDAWAGAVIQVTALDPQAFDTTFWRDLQAVPT